MRRCPRCQDQPLVSYSVDQLGIEGLSGDVQSVKGLVVEQCKSCRGLLLDITGAEQAVEAAGDLLKIKSAGLISATCEACGHESAPGATSCESCGKTLGLSCPSCDGTMVLAKVFRVELDVCQSCDALWFDDGELDKVHRRYRRKKAKEHGAPVAEPAPQAPIHDPKPLPTVSCLKCGQEGFRIRDVYKTKDGYVCRKCMGGKETNAGPSLSDGLINDGGLVSGVVDSMVTLAVVDAIFDLFKD